MAEERIHYSASFVLGNSYPELKDAAIIVTDFGGKLTVGVKARYYEATKHASGVVDFNPRHVGDFCVVDKNRKVEEFFGMLKEMLNNVSKAVEEAKAENQT